jgi:hypothetical protein
MKLPDLLVKTLDGLKPLEISYGAGGLKVFAATEFEAEQIGFAVDTDGSSLCDTDEGCWQSNWIVIGLDTGLGDPIFIDTQSDEFPVFTAIHGEGSWEPEPVAISLKAFAQCWGEFANIAKGRSNPVEQDENPPTEEEIDGFLSRVQKINGAKADIEFWQDILDY